MGAITLVGAAIYAPTLSTPFFFDDHLSIANNPTIRHLWPPGGALSPPHGQGITVEGRPILNFSLALNHAISGLNPWSYHALNVLIHIGAGLALFGIARRSLCPSARTSAPGETPAGAAGPGERATVPPGTAVFLAFVIALLWTVHPLQTESVTYVIQRAESLVGMFFLVTLYCFIRGAEPAAAAGARVAIGNRQAKLWLVISVGSCLLGMATKEIMYAAPIVVLLYDRAFLAGSLAEAWRRRRWYYSALAATWLVLASLVLATGNRGGTAGFGIGVTPWTYASSQFQALTHYLWLSFWPHPLIFDYGVYWPRGPGEVLPYALIVGALVVAAVYCLLKRPALGLLGFWFFSILAPTSSFLPGNRQTLAEHRMYLPLAPVIALVVVGVYRQLPGARPATRWSAFRVFAPLALATACCALTVRRNQDYRSEYALYRDTVAKRPGNVFAHYNLGKLLDESGAPEAAIAAYREAIRLEPHRSSSYNNLGKTLADLGRVDEAVEQYQTALRLNPRYGRAHYNLGAAMLRVDRKEEARHHFSEAVHLEPDDAEARDNLGGVLLELGRIDEAIGQFQAVLRLHPQDVAAHYMLGNALLLQGRPGGGDSPLRARLALPARLGRREAQPGTGAASGGDAVNGRKRSMASSRRNVPPKSPTEIPELSP